MPTDTSEKGVETLIMRHLTGSDGLFAGGAAAVTETPGEIAAEDVEVTDKFVYIYRAKYRA